MFLQRYESLGESFDPGTVEVRPAIRVNNLKISGEKLVKRLGVKKAVLTKIPFLQNGYWYEAEFSLGATPEYLQGLYYLQEAASQIPPLVLEPKPGEKVLDMAAAPGSKTTQLAEMMQNKGVIVALDSDARRLASLKNNIERLGISCVVTYKKDARFAFDLGQTFDKILLDAPCSGNFCIESDYFSSKTLTGVRERARLQKELLKSAYKVLVSGGTLVYSTCSLEPEENELVVDWFINKYDDIKLQPISVPIGDPGYTTVFDQKVDDSLKHTLRLWPHKTKTQGFFIAKMVKS